VQRKVTRDLSVTAKLVVILTKASVSQVDRCLYASSSQRQWKSSWTFWLRCIFWRKTVKIAI